MYSSNTPQNLSNVTAFSSTRPIHHPSFGVPSVRCDHMGYYGSPGWDRTSDKRINNPLLYQLSYRGMNQMLTGFRSTA